MANTPIDFLLNNKYFSIEYFFVLEGDHDLHHLPLHDIVIIGVAYSTANAALLESLAEAANNWPHPIINHPRSVLKTSRQGIAEALQDTDGIIAPRVVCIARSSLISHEYQLPSGLVYPIIVRPIDTHAGNDLQKIDDELELKIYIDRTASEFLYVTQFYEYRSSDGLYRKYRIALIDGEPFICHMALRDYWMIHYLNAGMLEDIEKRKAEAKAMAEFDDVFAARHRSAFSEIHRKIGLDYIVIDCTEAPDGKLLIFEADTGMIVHDMDSADIFPYKKSKIRELFLAFQEAILYRFQRDKDTGIALSRLSEQ